MKTYRIRLFLLGFLSLMLFVTIIARLYYLQIVCFDEYDQLARRQQNKLVQLIPRRGDITDRNGIILATSHFADNIILDTSRFLNPFDKKVTPTPTPTPRHGGKKDKKEPPPKTKLAPDPRFIHDLALAIKRPEDEIKGLFLQKPRRHILVRMAPQELEDAVHEMVVVAEQQNRIPPEAFLFEANGQREHPKNSLASHIIGYTNIDDNGDNIGKSGVEREYNEYLKGSVTTQSLPVTQTRKGLTPLKDEVIEATYGSNVTLTLDEQIQMFTESALQARVGEVQAKGGIAIVMDVASGEILALASCPDYNLNDYNKVDPAQMRNRTLTDPIEIGSVMKILTTTLLVEHGLLSPEEEINCQHMHGVVDGRVFTDTHDLGFVPFRQAFAASSNIALATVGLRLEPTTYYDGLTAFGLGQQTGVDLPGEGIGTLRTVDRWTRQSRTSLPIGYESSMTAMEVISALGAIGNDGWRMRPHVIKEIRSHDNSQILKKIEPMKLIRVAGAETCRTVRDLMEGVITLPMGTVFKLGKVPGYRVGGKTGTTIKTPPGVTPKTYIASFAGLIPIQAPRLAVYVYIDEPQMGVKYGGEVSYPVFRKIALHATHILGIPPDDPAALPQIARELAGDTLDSGGLTSATLAQTSSTLALESVDTTTETMAAEMDEPTLEDLALPRMPDCEGKTIPEAWQTLSDAGITSGVKTLGSGLVVHQEPLAGSLLRPGKGITLIFAHPSDSAKTVGAPEPIHAE